MREPAQPQVVDSTTGVVAMQWQHDGSLWACCSQPALLRRSADGGRSWHTILARDTTGLVGARRFDTEPPRAVAIGQEGEVWGSPDGGESWELQPVDLGATLHAAAFDDSGLVLVVGMEGRIARSTDRGQTWTQVGREEWPTLHAVTLLDSRHAFATGDDGMLLASKDGGRTWTPRATPTQQPLFAVLFADPQHGWCAGRSGTLLATINGGTTWEPLDSGTTSTLFALACAGRSRLAAAGDAGVLLTTRDGGTHLVPHHTAGKDHPDCQWRAIELTPTHQILLGGFGVPILRIDWR